MSKVLKWAQNTQVKLNGKSTNGNGTQSCEKKWIHSPEALQKGHVVYLVKFLGNVVVDQPKGIETVKDGIRKLRFSQQLRKSESGAKTRKVELTVSADGVAIQEPRSHVILHQFPLHRISYCADDKGEKKFFSFIAKQPNQIDNELEEKHECFVFISDKLAEEITLTIGQAFELAYKRFLDTSGRDLESQRRSILLQQRIKLLEDESNIYKQRLQDLAKLCGMRGDLQGYLEDRSLKSILEIPDNFKNNTLPIANGAIEHNTNSNTKLVDLAEDTNGAVPPVVPPRNFVQMPTVGTKLENLLINELSNDDDFNPRSFEDNSTASMGGHCNGNSSSPPLLAPPPKTIRRNVSPSASTDLTEDLFGITPFNHSTTTNTNSHNANAGSANSDPFEMDDFGSVDSKRATSQDLENAIGMLDKRILEMKTGFSRGICFGNENFSLESLDPLKI